MSSNRKYSIIFMRDDQNVKRFRMSPAWMKIFIYFLIFLVAVAVAGAYFGTKYWKAHKNLTMEKKVLETRLSEAQIKLERLENVEKILESNGPDEIQALFGSPPQIPPAQEKKETPGESVSLDELFVSVNTGQASISELAASLDGRKMTVDFNVNNEVADTTLSGRASIDLVTNDGSLVKVDYSGSDMTFQIQRFRKITAVFELPEGVKVKDVFGVKLQLKTSDGKLIFSETYPLSDLVA